MIIARAFTAGLQLKALNGLHIVPIAMALMKFNPKTNWILQLHDEIFPSFADHVMKAVCRLDLDPQQGRKSLLRAIQ